MDLRQLIIDEFTTLLREDDLSVPEFHDDLVLLETDLDSLGFAVLVTRLEVTLGYDPFLMTDEAIYPETFKELVKIYDRFAPDSSATS